MLPSSKTSLTKGGLSSSAAAFTLIGCFLGGVIGIQIVSHVLHRFIPSHVVDCDHTHKDEAPDDDNDFFERRDEDVENQITANQPLLTRVDEDEELQQPETPVIAVIPAAEKPSTRLKLVRSVTSFLSNSKSHCTEGGPCRGYSHPCGDECYKIVSQNPSQTASMIMASGKQNSDVSHEARSFRFFTLAHSNDPAEAQLAAQSSDNRNYGSFQHWRETDQHSSDDSDDEDDSYNELYESRHSHSKKSAGTAHHHHHHVASNAFMSIGLQTSIAIALHKLPEGFITYATNHANPKLGTSIFMALFVHNITEGFALALPLFLALNSRLKAILWASLLGGASQPLGAGIAEVWFRVARSRDMVPSEGVYGIMFAITSGIMTNVALQLFSESLGLIHKKGLCIAMAFVGMGILGFCNALTA
jgi:zinc transporter, ZIP family